MLETFAAIGPLFAVLAIGAIASRSSRIAATESALTTFVIYFALPAFLFGAVAGAPIKGGVPLAFALISFGVTALVTVLTYAIAFAFRGRSRELAAPISLAAGYGNVGYLGVPITIALVGPQAGLAAAIGNLIPTLMFLIGYPLIRTLVTAGGLSARALWVAIKGAVLTNPITLSIAAGIIAAQTGLPIPGVVMDTVSLFGQAAIPLAMFAVGLTLPGATTGILDGSVPLLTLGFGALMKMVALPLLTVLAIVLFAGSMDHKWGATLILMAAMPTSATAFVLSTQSDRDPRIVSAMIAATSTLGLVTIPVISGLFVL